MDILRAIGDLTRNNSFDVERGESRLSVLTSSYNQTGMTDLMIREGVVMKASNDSSFTPTNVVKNVENVDVSPTAPGATVPEHRGLGGLRPGLGITVNISSTDDNEFDKAASSDSSGDEGDLANMPPAAAQSSDLQSTRSLTPPKPRVATEDLVANLQLVEERTVSFDEGIHEVLRCVQPPESTLHKRLSIFAMIRGQARVAINSSIFEYGTHELGCNLPNDPVLISVLLSKSNFPNWHTSLSERLTAVAEGSEDQWIEGMEATQLSGAPSNHSISNVEHQSDENGFFVSCMVDSIRLKISSNRRVDLCFLAFVEEVAGLVGKNNLFKRSLLLVRSWWSYEVVSLMNKDISSYLPWNVVTIMVCALFNKHHGRLVCPLQALCLFIAEYVVYQDSCSVITLQGMVKFDPQSKEPLKLIPPQPSHLISWELTEKYWMLFNTSNQVPAGGQQSPQTFSSQSWENQPKAQFNPYSTAGSVPFHKTGFRVLHPFTNKPMISDRVTPRRMNFIVEAFRLGASKLIEFFLRDPAEDASIMANVSSFLFPNSLAKFPPAVAASSTVDPALGDQQDFLPRPVFDSSFITASVERIWQNILYCNFVMEAIVTESAILTATIENLSIRGPLPVGEVGKMLTEICGLPQLSLHLKEKFGGLKKFLERFPDIFVFSNDHPFNPHLLMRAKLNKDHQKMIYRGVIPMQIMTGYKKVRAPRDISFISTQSNGDVFDFRLTGKFQLD